MAYATEAQAIDLYGTPYVTIACRDPATGNLDSARLAKALNVASNTMNGYLLGRYPLPLATPPESFQKYCVDIALYDTAATADVGTEKLKERYDAAIKYFELVAQNRIKLETATDTTETNLSQASSLETKSNLSLVSSDERQFRRDDMKELM